VDANILIFERMKEETKRGRALHDAILEGFARAWTSIRDSNLSSIISAVILFWFGTSMVKGFALVLGIGVTVSMFTALTATRTLLLALGVAGENKFVKFLFGSGIKS
jgi:protein-export membrane protein SecD